MDPDSSFNNSGVSSTPNRLGAFINTICNKELVDKVRAIADRNHSSIRDVIELMFRRCNNAYEQKNGIITIEQKKPLEKLF